MLRADDAPLRRRPSLIGRTLAGYEVTGSDQAVYPPMSTLLADLGIAYREGYRAENLAGGMKAWKAAGLPIEPADGWIA